MREPPEDLDSVGEASGAPTDRFAAAPPWYLLLPVFAVLAFAMTFRSLGRFDSHMVGNSGDPVFVLWILGWVQHAIPHGWASVWDTSMYSPVDNTLAFSDSMLSVALAQWPLRILFGPALSLNILAVAAQTATLWFTYRLAFVLTRSWPAAIVAALLFGFSTPLLSHLGHTQLLLAAFLVPLTLLLLVRYLETFQIRFGLGVGVALAALCTSATYYALMTAVGVGVVVVGYGLWFRPRPVWTAVRGLAVGAGVALVLVLPVAAQYTQLQDDPYFKRGFDPSVAAHVGDFLSPDGGTYVLAKAPVFDDLAFDRGIENHLFPGFVTIAFAIVGTVVLIRILRSRRGTLRDESPSVALHTRDGVSPGTKRWRARTTVLIAAAGVAAVLLAFGDEVRVFGQAVPMPMKVARKVVPGFSGIRATSRFALLGQCALALVAAFGVRALLERVRRRTAVVIVLVLCALVLTEAARSIPLVEVPDGARDKAAGEYLATRPPGVVAELPIRGELDGPVWAYTESPRLLASLVDANDRLNGYSGYTPPGFDEIVPVLNTFPAPEAMKQFDKRDVRYVVLRTRVIGDQFPVFDELLGQDGVGRFTPETARARIAEIPPDRVRRVTRVPGAYVVELRD